MADQFSKWDAFMRQVDRSLTIEEGFQRYRRSRARRGTLPKKKPTPLQKAKEQWSARRAANETKRHRWVKTLEAQQLVEESLAKVAGKASKNDI